MIQLFICQWCGYVEEKELPEECQEGVFHCTCCSMEEVESLFTRN
ncbi:hypothetical protein [Brevibacillus formosus]|nr:hypothetical protein [Brevibacillus formosus]